MKHYYKRIILCVVLFLLIFILFKISNKEGAVNLNDTNNQLQPINNLYTSNMTDLKMLFTSLQGANTIISGDYKINFTTPVTCTNTTCSITNNGTCSVGTASGTSTATYRQGVNWGYAYVSRNATTGRGCNLTSQPECSITDKSDNGYCELGPITNGSCTGGTASGSTCSNGALTYTALGKEPNATAPQFNIITGQNDVAIITKVDVTNFKGLNILLKNILKEIFNITMIEKNIMYFITLSKRNVIHQDYAKNKFASNTDINDAITNLDASINTMSVNSTKNMLKLGAFIITEKSVVGIIDDLSNNNYQNISSYFDTNIIATEILSQGVIPTKIFNYTSKIGFDNNNNTTIGTYRQNINSRRNCLIYNLIIIARLYSTLVTSNINSTGDDKGSVYDLLRNFIKDSPDSFINQSLDV